MGVLDLALLVIRGFQALFALIVVGLTGHIADEYLDSSRNNFMIFVAVWTLLVLVYLALAPQFFASLANVFAILALDALTMLFWFASFIALAVLYHDFDTDGVRGFRFDGHGTDTCDFLPGFCHQMEAAVVFGAFEWALFAVTTVLATLNALRNRNKGGGGTGTV